MVRCVIISALAFIVTAGCMKKQREGIALIVNGHEITSAQVLQAAEMIKESMVAAFPEKAFDGSTDNLSAGAAWQLAANWLLIEEAKKLGIEAGSAAIDSAYATFEKRFPDHAAFEREIIKMGETDSSFREQIGNGIRLDALIKRILADTPPPDTQECQDFYQKNREHYMGSARMRVSQIFLPFVDSISDSQKQALYEKAVELRRQVLQGAGFAELAKKHSRGPGAYEGGDIGWFNKGDLRSDLEEPLLQLKKGEVSDVITTDIGLFLLKKTDEEAPTQLPYKEVENRIRFLLEIRQRNRLISRYIDSLMATAKIEYIDKSLAHSKPLSGVNLLPEMVH